MFVKPSRSRHLGESIGWSESVLEASKQQTSRQGYISCCRPVLILLILPTYLYLNIYLQSYNMALICLVQTGWEEVEEVESVSSSDGSDGDSAVPSDESDDNSALPSDESDGESIVSWDDSADYRSGYSDDGGSLITPADSIADLDMPSLDGFSIESEDEVSSLLSEELRDPS
jgi:hypothetical protein